MAAGALLAMARGAMQGQQDKKDRASQKEREELQRLILLSQTDGFSFGETESPDPAAGMPEIPDVQQQPSPAPAPAPMPGAPASPLDAARAAVQGMGGQQATAQEPAGSPIPPGGAPVGAAPPSSAGAPVPASRGGPFEVARSTIGGVDRPIMFDPSQTAAARRQRKEALNQAAYERMRQDPSGAEALGAFDPGIDYAGQERKERETEAMVRALVDAGENENDARVLARHNVDLRARRDQQQQREAQRRQLADAAAERAETRERRKREDRLGEASGSATLWAQQGLDESSILQALQGMFKDLTPGERAAIAVEAVRGQRRFNTDLDARARSNQPRATSGTINIGGEEVSLDGTAATRTPASAPAAAPASGGSSVDAAVASFTDAEIDAAIEEAGGDIALASKILADRLKPRTP